MSKKKEKKGSASGGADKKATQDALVEVQEEHGTGMIVTRSPVHCIYVANGFVYCGSWDNNVQQYDIKTGKLLRELEGHTGYVHCMCLDNNSLFTGSLDHDVRHFDAKSGACRQVYSGHTGAVQAITHRDGIVFSGSGDCTIRSWDVKKGECLLVFTGHTGYVQCLAFNDAVLYSGSWDCSIRAWDIKTGSCTRVFQGHRGWVFSISLWGDRMYSGSQESIIRVWDLKSGECISALEGHDEAIQHVLLSIPEAERKKKKAGADILPVTGAASLTSDFNLGCGELYTASKDKTIKVWDLATGECKCTLTGHTAPVHSLQIFEKSLLSASLDHSIRIWDLKSIHSQRKKPTTQ